MFFSYPWHKVVGSLQEFPYLIMRNLLGIKKKTLMPANESFSKYLPFKN